MWHCKQCGEAIEDQFDSCWKCTTPKDDAQGDTPETPAAAGTEPSPWRVTFKYFRGTLASWDQLFSEAAHFATEIGSQRLINISHPADDDDGVVTVW